MSSIDRLTAAVDDMRALVAAGVAHMQNLSAALAHAHTQATEAAAVEQLAADLQASADQLRGALAALAQHPNL